MFHNDSIKRIFRFGGEDLLNAKDEGYVEDNDNLEIRPLTEIFSKFHNSIVGHYGISNTLKAI